MDQELKQAMESAIEQVKSIPGIGEALSEKAVVVVVVTVVTECQVHKKGD